MRAEDVRGVLAFQVDELHGVAGVTLAGFQPLFAPDLMGRQFGEVEAQDEGVLGRDRGRHAQFVGPAGDPGDRDLRAVQRAGEQHRRVVHTEAACDGVALGPPAAHGNAGVPAVRTGRFWSGKRMRGSPRSTPAAFVSGRPIYIPIYMLRCVRGGGFSSATAITNLRGRPCRGMPSTQIATAASVCGGIRI
ncbi:MAG: hypothetical protein P4L71_13690 [Acetobacteraceae bacterium]|nr:hypothetical protein [Acetobacteraceae bacterium]